MQSCKSFISVPIPCTDGMSRVDRGIFHRSHWPYAGPAARRGISRHTERVGETQSVERRLSGIRFGSHRELIFYFGARSNALTYVIFTHVKRFPKNDRILIFFYFFKSDRTASIFKTENLPSFYHNFRLFRLYVYVPTTTRSRSLTWPLGLYISLPTKPDGVAC